MLFVVDPKGLHCHSKSSKEMFAQNSGEIFAQNVFWLSFGNSQFHFPPQVFILVEPGDWLEWPSSAKKKKAEKTKPKKVYYLTDGSQGGNVICGRKKKSSLPDPFPLCASNLILKKLTTTQGKRANLRENLTDKISFIFLCLWVSRSKNSVVIRDKNASFIQTFRLCLIHKSHWYYRHK